jgi:hypothetical protein
MIAIDNSFRAASLAAAVFGCAPAFALDTQTAWEGFMVNTGATPACAGVGGAGVNDVHVSVYRPHILPTDTKHSFLSVVFLHAAFTLVSKILLRPQIRRCATAAPTRRGS